jgi:hypothetical protein
MDYCQESLLFDLIGKPAQMVRDRPESEARF